MQCGALLDETKYQTRLDKPLQANPSVTERVQCGLHLLLQTGAICRTLFPETMIYLSLCLLQRGTDKELHTKGFGNKD